MTSLPTISVIIPSYNSNATIERCITSVIRTGYLSLEILVVDDASTDNSPHVVDALCTRYPGMVRRVRHTHNSGPATGRNTGAAHATSEALFFLDSDTEMLPDALHRFAARLQDADAVTGIYHFEPCNPGWTPRYKALLNYYFFSRKGVIPYEVFDASRAGIRATVFRQLGGFNEQLGWGMDYENEEFGYRLCKQHYHNVLDPSVAVKHVFPGFTKLTTTYFARVALWMEVFVHRRAFESGGVTSAGTGVSTAALLIGFLFLSMAWIHQGLLWVALVFGLVYLAGYLGFFRFVARTRPSFLPIAILFNIYFSAVLASAAITGLCRVLSGRSKVRTQLL